MDDAISVLIVDDHPVVREGLTTLLSDEPSVRVVGEAEDGETAVVRIASLEPQVVLMDMMLPGLDGIDTIRAARAAGSQSRFIILTSCAGDQLRVGDALRAGAIGYLLKDVSKRELLRAIREAAANRTVLHGEAQQALLAETVSEPAPHDALTPRERAVLELIAGGRSNKRIAGELSLSEGTVKGYVSLVLAKLNVTDRTQAALYAVEHGLTKKS